MATFPQTPSGLNEQARQRGPRHEAMQRSFMEFLRARRVTVGIPPGATVHRHVESELILDSNARIGGFVDCAEILSVSGASTIASLFEIKPVIDDVYGIVRQAKAILFHARRAIIADQHWCYVVVPADDPLIDDLRAEWPHVWAFGASFKPEDEDIGEANE